MQVKEFQKLKFLIFLAFHEFNQFQARFRIIDKRDGSVVNPEFRYEAKPFVIFHHINAYEENGKYYLFYRSLQIHVRHRARFMRLYGEVIPELYLTCTMTSSVDLAYYGVSRAEYWVSLDCGTIFDKDFFLFH